MQSGAVVCSERFSHLPTPKLDTAAMAVQVFMEAAIPMSKLDQDAVYFVRAMKR